MLVCKLHINVLIILAFKIIQLSCNWLLTSYFCSCSLSYLDSIIHISKNCFWIVTFLKFLRGFWGFCRVSEASEIGWYKFYPNYIVGCLLTLLRWGNCSPDWWTLSDDSKICLVWITHIDVFIPAGVQCVPADFGLRVFSTIIAITITIAITIAITLTTISTPVALFYSSHPLFAPLSLSPLPSPSSALLPLPW